MIRPIALGIVMELLNRSVSAIARYLDSSQLVAMVTGVHYLESNKVGGDQNTCSRSSLYCLRTYV